MRRLWIIAVLMLAFIAGCGTKGEPPCPPGAKNVSAAEADAGLERRARKEVASGKGGDVGVELTCRGSRERWKIGVPFRRIVDCMEQTIPLSAAMGLQMTLSECLIYVAKMEYARVALGIGDDVQAEDFDARTAEAVMREARAAKCAEVWRAAEVKADDHGLNRIGADGWVPATLWMILNAVEGAAGPAPAMMFLLKPGAGVEEACVDVAPPPKRCTSTDGCIDRPAGAEDAGITSGGGDVIPPGTDPGTSGDYP